MVQSNVVNRWGERGDPLTDQERLVAGWGVQSNVDLGLLNKELAPTERFQINQAIEKRGGLRFNYAPTNTNSAVKVVWVPFYENPQITESRKANYASTKIFLRNEPVRLYTGSEPRKFRVEINYSLIHMAAMVSADDMSDIFGGIPEEFIKDIRAIKTYLQQTANKDTGSTHLAAQSDPDVTREAKLRGSSREGPWGPNRWWNGTAPHQPDRAAERFSGHEPTFLQSIGAPASIAQLGARMSPPQASQGSNYWNFALMWTMRATDQWAKHHALLQIVMNNIRSAVIGTAQMPVKGPPIVELKWGAAYNFTPCIITDYKIQPVEVAGYDAKSLTAQRIKISLSLEEMRNINGNLWGSPEIGGDLPGWDSIANLGTIDPFIPRGPITYPGGRV